MSTDPDGRVALVTGAARGIGAAVVRRLTMRGYHVYALDACAASHDDTPYPLAEPDDLKAVVAAEPDRITGVVADVRDAEQLRLSVAEIRRLHGRLDTVVAGAAVIAGGLPQWDTPAEVLTLLWQTDAVGVWNTAQATVPLLLEQPPEREPSFVAITSAAAAHGLRHLTAYCMAKHAVLGLVRGLAADLQGTAVSVCAVSPGSTRTSMLAATADLYRLTDIAPFTANQTIGRLLEPDEVAAAVEFACTAGPVVHGAVVPAEGGFRE